MFLKVLASFLIDTRASLASPHYSYLETSKEVGSAGEKDWQPEWTQGLITSQVMVEISRDVQQAGLSQTRKACTPTDPALRGLKQQG